MNIDLINNELGYHQNVTWWLCTSASQLFNIVCFMLRESCEQWRLLSLYSWDKRFAQLIWGNVHTCKKNTKQMILFANSHTSIIRIKLKTTNNTNPGLVDRDFCCTIWCAYWPLFLGTDMCIIGWNYNTRMHNYLRWTPTRECTRGLSFYSVW